MTKYNLEDITSIYMSKMRLKYKLIPVQIAWDEQVRITAKTIRPTFLLHFLTTLYEYLNQVLKIFQFQGL